MLSQEQVNQVKQELFKQLESWPESQRELAKQEIEKMNEQELEEFLIKNKLIKTEQKQASQCIFCEITKGSIPSYKIAETKDAIAILEINPVSKAHTLILPKAHINKSNEEIQKFAEKIASKISETFSPKDVQIITGGMFNHLSVNILPIYENETIESPRKKACEEELEKIQKQLTEEKPKEKPKPEKKLSPEEKIKLKKEELKKLPKAPKRQP